MQQKRLYVNIPLDPHQIVTLDKKQSHYLRDVLRVKTEQELILFNGDNHEYLCAIEKLTKTMTCLKVIEKKLNSKESPFKIILGQVLAKGEKMDLILQKATELGVCEIVPLLSKNTNVKLDETRLAKKIAHWEKVIIAACMLSGRNALPILHPPLPLNTWLSKKTSDLNLFLCPSASRSLSSIQNADYQSASITIGPEGGFDQTEVELAINKKWELMSLGKRILRTETAGFAVMSCLLYQFGDF